MSTDFTTPPSTLAFWDLSKSSEAQTLLDQLALLAPLKGALVLSGAMGTGRRELAGRVHKDSGNAHLQSISPEWFAVNGMAALCDIGDDAKCKTVVVEELERWPESAYFVFTRWLRGESANIRPIFLAGQAFVRQQPGVMPDELYFALSVASLSVPSLCQRREDIPVLLKTCSQMTKQSQRFHSIRFSAAAMQCLKAYHWPGNLLELRSLVERLEGLLPNTVIQVGNLPKAIQESKNASEALNLENNEIEAIKKALKVAQGNKSRAARLLGVSRDTLNYRLRKYALL